MILTVGTKCLKPTVSLSTQQQQQEEEEEERSNKTTNTERLQLRISNELHCHAPIIVANVW